MSRILQHMWDGLYEFIETSLFIFLGIAVILAFGLQAITMIWGNLAALSVIGLVVMALAANAFYQAVRSR